MKRRYFLALGFMTSLGNRLLAMDYRKYYSKAWASSSLDDAAMALYGREKFSTLKKSKDVRLTVPAGIVSDRQNIAITIDATIEAKTLAIFQDVNKTSLVAVFNVAEQGALSYEIYIRMERKGTLFAVLEGLDGTLYYDRKYVDILTLSCMAA